jgi:hypothetical protein
MYWSDMATIVKTPSGTWKAVIRKTGWATIYEETDSGKLAGGPELERVFSGSD